MPKSTDSEDLCVTWPTHPISVQNGEISYRSCSFNGTTYSEGDFTLINTGFKSSDVGVCQIQQLYQNTIIHLDNPNAARIRWFYLIKELPKRIDNSSVRLNSPLVPRYEVVRDIRKFDLTSVESFQDLCKIRFVGPDRLPLAEEESEEEGLGTRLFYCRYQLQEGPKPSWPILTLCKRDSRSGDWDVDVLRSDEDALNSTRSCKSSHLSQKPVELEDSGQCITPFDSRSRPSTSNTYEDFSGFMASDCSYSSFEENLCEMIHLSELMLKPDPAEPVPEDQMICTGGPPEAEVVVGVTGSTAPPSKVKISIDDYAQMLASIQEVPIAEDPSTSCSPSISNNIQVPSNSNDIQDPSPSRQILDDIKAEADDTHPEVITLDDDNEESVKVEADVDVGAASGGVKNCVCIDPVFRSKACILICPASIANRGPTRPEHCMSRMSNLSSAPLVIQNDPVVVHPQANVAAKTNLDVNLIPPKREVDEQPHVNIPPAVPSTSNWVYFPILSNYQKACNPLNAAGLSTKQQVYIPNTTLNTPVILNTTPTAKSTPIIPNRISKVSIPTSSMIPKHPSPTLNKTGVKLETDDRSVKSVPSARTISQAEPADRNITNITSVRDSVKSVPIPLRPHTSCTVTSSNEANNTSPLVVNQPIASNTPDTVLPAKNITLTPHPSGLVTSACSLPPRLSNQPIAFNTPDAVLPAKNVTLTPHPSGLVTSACSLPPRLSNQPITFNALDTVLPANNVTLTPHPSGLVTSACSLPPRLSNQPIASNTRDTVLPANNVMLTPHPSGLVTSACSLSPRLSNQPIVPKPLDTVTSANNILSKPHTPCAVISADEDNRPRSTQPFKMPDPISSDCDKPRQKMVARAPRKQRRTEEIQDKTVAEPTRAKQTKLLNQSQTITKPSTAVDQMDERNSRPSRTIRKPVKSDEFYSAIFRQPVESSDKIPKTLVRPRNSVEVATLKEPGIVKNAGKNTKTPATKVGNRNNTVSTPSAVQPKETNNEQPIKDVNKPAEISRGTILTRFKAGNVRKLRNRGINLSSSLRAFYNKNIITADRSGRTPQNPPKSEIVNKPKRTSKRSLANNKPDETVDEQSIKDVNKPAEISRRTILTRLKAGDVRKLRNRGINLSSSLRAFYNKNIITADRSGRTLRNPPKSQIVNKPKRTSKRSLAVDKPDETVGVQTRSVKKPAVRQPVANDVKGVPTLKKTREAVQNVKNPIATNRPIAAVEEPVPTAVKAVATKKPLVAVEKPIAAAKMYSSTSDEPVARVLRASVKPVTTGSEVIRTVVKPVEIVNKRCVSSEHVAEVVKVVRPVVSAKKQVVPSEPIVELVKVVVKPVDSVNKRVVPSEPVATSAEVVKSVLEPVTAVERPVSAHTNNQLNRPIRNSAALSHPSVVAVEEPVSFSTANIPVPAAEKPVATAAQPVMKPAGAVQSSGNTNIKREKAAYSLREKRAKITVDPFKRKYTFIRRLRKKIKIKKEVVTCQCCVDFNSTANTVRAPGGRPPDTVRKFRLKNLQTARQVRLDMIERGELRAGRYPRVSCALHDEGPSGSGTSGS